MYYLNNICFVCLSSEANLIAVYNKETNNEIFIKVKYVLPELILNPEISVLYICSSCNTTLCSFFMFKKKSLENSNRLNDYKNIMQGNNDAQGQSFSELQTRLINCLPLIKYENDTHLNIEKKEVVLLHDLRTEVDDNVEVKEESLASEDSADRAFYQQLVKSESVSDDELDGNSSAASEDNSTLDKDETNSNTHTDSQLFQCSICNEVFTDRLTFDSHLKIHINNITDLKCLICNKRVSNKFNLKCHLIIHAGIKDYKCSICNKKFSYNCTLKKHMKIHAGIKDYKCSICEKKFTQISNLKTHMKTHEGIKEYKCSICEKKFSLNGYLKKHMKIHVRITKYKCSICEKKFSQSGYFKIHMKIHAGIKDYKCSICEKKFTQTSSLKTHMKMHTDIKDYKCSICEKKFRLNVSLKIHMKIHAGINDYECSICNKKFVRNDHLKRHAATHKND